MRECDRRQRTADPRNRLRQPRPGGVGLVRQRGVAAGPPGRSVRRRLARRGDARGQGGECGDADHDGEGSQGAQGSQGAEGSRSAQGARGAQDSGSNVKDAEVVDAEYAETK